MKVTLTNDFHNTKVTLNGKEQLSGTLSNRWDVRLSAQQVKKARLALCGMDGCSCSGELGTNGKQNYEDVLYLRDGGVKLIDVVED